MDTLELLARNASKIPFFLIGFAVIGIVLYVVQTKRRWNQLRDIAARLSLKLDRVGDAGILDRFSSFGVFQRGPLIYSRKVFNLLHGGGEIVSFEYKYSKLTSLHRGGPQKKSPGSRIIRKTVVCCESPALNLPPFVLKPEGRIGNWFRDVLGGVDVDFDSHPVFSKKYHLSGEAPEAIRGAFSNEALSYIEERPGLCVEGNGHQMVVYKARGNPGAKLESFILEASQIAALLKR